jgi:hypothetical protein
MKASSGISFLFVMVVCLHTLCPVVKSSVEPQLNREQQQEFLLHARVIRSRHIGEGITNPYRLTLTDGVRTHDAAFQPVNERSNFKRFANGTVEMNYVDSYLYNVAAYKLAVMLGLQDMIPVTVRRQWRGMTGSLSWWLDVRMDEGERIEKSIRPPDVSAFNRQMREVKVFRELVYDSDLNVRNVLIGENWEVYMIDFTRAFRLYRNLREPRDLQMCSRALWSGLLQLDLDALVKETEGLLTKNEVEGVMARRDLIVAHFKELIAEKGEENVLY